MYSTLRQYEAHYNKLRVHHINHQLAHFIQIKYNNDPFYTLIFFIEYLNRNMYNIYQIKPLIIIVDQFNELLRLLQRRTSLHRL